MQIAQNNLRTIKNELLPRLSALWTVRRFGYGWRAQSCLPSSEQNAPLPFLKISAGLWRIPSTILLPNTRLVSRSVITLRNRVAKADQFRAALDFRKQELNYEQQKKNILLDVRNSQYALQQAQARVTASQKARDLAKKTFDIAKQEQKLGAMSAYDTLATNKPWPSPSLLWLFLRRL